MIKKKKEERLGLTLRELRLLTCDVPIENGTGRRGRSAETPVTSFSSLLASSSRVRTRSDWFSGYSANLNGYSTVERPFGR